MKRILILHVLLILAALAFTTVYVAPISAEPGNPVLAYQTELTTIADT